jgi:hypothetical protein
LRAQNRRREQAGGQEFHRPCAVGVADREAQDRRRDRRAGSGGEQTRSMMRTAARTGMSAVMAGLVIEVLCG